eukprot:5415684-Pyramimonas_sp.AAC.1
MLLAFPVVFASALLLSSKHPWMGRGLQVFPVCKAATDFADLLTRVNPDPRQPGLAKSCKVLQDPAPKP